MTKKQYLTKLKNLIQGLPLDEQKEALAYYSNYLDEADDLQQTIEELGSPEDLASSIIDKFSCVPAKVKTSKKKSTEDESFKKESSFDNAYYDNYEDESLEFTFEKEKIANLGIAVGTGNIVIKSGSVYKVETRGISSMDFRCEVNKAGTLIIENRKGFPQKKNRYDGKKSHWGPRILITIPSNVKLDNFKISVEAGKLATKGVSLFSNRTMIDVKASDFRFKGIKSKATVVNCTMGNLELAGSFTGLTKINSNMGSVSIDVEESEREVSFQSSVFLGSARFNGKKLGGIKEDLIFDRKENHYVVTSKLSNVYLRTSDF